jgi:hypothetical protein
MYTSKPTSRTQGSLCAMRGSNTSRRSEGMCTTAFKSRMRVSSGALTTARSISSSDSMRCRTDGSCARMSMRLARIEMSMLRPERRETSVRRSARQSTRPNASTRKRMVLTTVLRLLCGCSASAMFMTGASWSLCFSRMSRSTVFVCLL